jgi:hypothetical protein
VPSYAGPPAVLAVVFCDDVVVEFVSLLVTAGFWQADSASNDTAASAALRMIIIGNIPLTPA